MKMKNREFSILFFFAILSLVVFVLGEIATVSTILYNANKGTVTLFRLGEMLGRLWIPNPIPLVLSIIGAVMSRRYRKYYIAIICFSAVAWLVGGVMIAPYF